MRNTGERQVSPTLDGIRKDHINRYSFVADLLGGAKIYDLGCGIGYGSNVLAQAGCSVFAIDKSHEAIAFANEHYSHQGIQFIQGNLNDWLFQTADAAVCFEVIEHIKDPLPLLRRLRTSVNTLIASVPNETAIPWGKGNYDYHHRHYTKDEFKALLASAGWDVTEWRGQTGPESPVSDDLSGRTLIAICSHGVERFIPVIRMVSAVPESVAIIGLGPSKHEYVSAVCGAGDRRKLFDQTWVINGAISAIDHDMVVHMDDFRIQEIRAEARPGSNIAAMVELLKTHSKPILTSRAYPDYPSSVEMPLEEMINDLTYDYFNNTAAWAMAYAIHLGVKRVGLFGCDYTYKNRHDAEKGRACLEFWMGYGAARGVKFTLAQSTTLMDACEPREERLYGFDTRRAIFNRNETGRVTVSFEEVESLPTADEIEWRYNHSRHPNSIAEEMES